MNDRVRALLLVAADAAEEGGEEHLAHVIRRLTYDDATGGAGPFKAVAGSAKDAMNNWLLCSFGCSSIDNRDWYVTTNNVHASDTITLSDAVPYDPSEMAPFLADKLNEEWRKWINQRQTRLPL
ncbi:MAG: hypothetical protein GY835_23800 [bacterium]|nr:hypothetical protein [bacterium]